MRFDRNKPIKALIIWEPSVADPAHFIWAATPDGIRFNFGWWGRFLVRQLAKLIVKAHKRIKENEKLAERATDAIFHQ